MGRYDSEYSKYYNSISNKSKVQGPYGNINNGYKKKKKSSFYSTRCETDPKQIKNLAFQAA